MHSLQHTPPNILKQKVGSGGIPPEKLEQAELCIKNNKIDFLSEALEILQNIKIETQKIKANPANFKADDLTIYIIQLKSGGGMFGYNLITDIANNHLDFVEKIEKIDAETHTVLKYHEQALSIVIDKNLTSDSAEGSALFTELKNLSERYFTKHGQLLH